MFLAELNKLETWATDIGNAYLEAETAEKIYIEAGPEFGERYGHFLIIRKALYGLRSSGARWHDKFSDCLRELGFQPCKAEPDIWMRRNGNMYEYVAVYVDDLAIVLQDPQAFVDILMKKYNFKLKGTGPISFHLGMDFYRDDDQVLCIAPRKYIERMVATYERMFGELPKQTVTSPLEKGDHPELDTSDLLDDEGITTYQSLVGALQWLVTIGRFDITTAVMTMSGFRVAPRQGHLDRLKRIYGYLCKMRHAVIRIRPEEPDYSDLSDMEYDWSRSVYGELEEVLPTDTPEPLGNYVTLTHYVDANLMHDVTTGRSVTGILHLVNKTPIDWYSKKQATVETATYGSEFVAARTCVEQIIDLRNTLRYLGVPVRNKSYMFGDNKSVVDSSMQIHAKLHKRHNMLSFHRVREAIASGMLGFYHIPGDTNPADILSKHWGYSQVWNQLKTLLFWKGDTAKISSQSHRHSPSTERGVTNFE
jgi:Reverse transcriptase (RNA-dependent DNA polymerase)